MIKIIYDATILSNYNATDGRRSGIFFVALNMLKEFARRQDLEILLYCSPEQYENLVPFIDAEFPKLKFVYSEPYKRFIKLRNIQRRLQKWNPSNILVHKARTANLLLIRFILKSILRSDKTDIADIMDSIDKTYLSQADIYFSPMMKIPGNIGKLANLKKITMIYDMIPFVMPEYGAATKSGWFSDMIKSVNGNDYYFAISSSAREDFIKYCRLVTPRNVYIPYIGISSSIKRNIDKACFKKAQKKYKNLPENYIFSLCSLEERKNLVMQIRAFFKFIKKNNINNLYYIIGGGETEYAIIKKKIKNAICGLDQYIVYIGYVDDSDLSVLYSNARWFTFTSKYEGFGIPPVEAMKCGCPVVAGNNSSFPEVCGDAAILVNSDSESEHISAYEKYYFDEKLRNEMIEKGYKQAGKFNWPDIVDSMVGYFNDIIVR